MAERPTNARYTKTHEWVIVEGDVATVGITDYAVEHLSDLTFIDLPQVGTVVKQFEPFGEIESVKAVEDINAPVSGEVIEVNDALRDQLELLSQDPYGAGWMIKVKIADPAELDKLMNLDDYNSFCEEESG